MNDESKPRLTRLAAILTLLQSKPLITARELAEHYQVSIRTIYRDIRTLEDSGVPIVVEEGKGYSLLEGYHLPPVMFTEQEANALITAEQFMLQDKDQSLVESYRDAVAKIKAVLRNSQKAKAQLLSERIQIRVNLANEKTSEYLTSLQLAITNFQLIKLQYLSLQGQASERLIEPFAVYSTQGNWILIAFCRLRNDFRAFRLDCMQALEAQEEYFEPHPISLQEYFEQCRKKMLTTPDIPLSPSPITFEASKTTNNQNNKSSNGNNNN